MTIEPREVVPGSAFTDEAGARLVALLTGVLAEEDVRGMLFRDVRATARHHDGELRDEPIDLSRHVRDTHVKAGAYGRLLAE